MMLAPAAPPRHDTYVDLGYQYPRPKHKCEALTPPTSPTSLCTLVYLPLVCAMLLSSQTSISMMSEMMPQICDVSKCYLTLVASVVTYFLVAGVSICYLVAKEELVKQMPKLTATDSYLSYKIKKLSISSWRNTDTCIGLREVHKKSINFIASTVQKVVSIVTSDSLSAHGRDKNNSSEKKSLRPPSIVLSSYGKRKNRQTETYMKSNMLKTDNFCIFSMMVNTMHRKHTRKKKKCNKKIKVTKCVSYTSSESSPGKEPTENSSYDVDDSQKSSSFTINTSETKSFSNDTSNETITGKRNKDMSKLTILWGSICRRPGIFDSSSESKLDILNSSSSIICSGNRKSKKKKKHKRFSSSESFDTVSFEEEMSFESILSSGSYASTEPGTTQVESEQDTTSEYDSANENPVLEVYTSQTSVNQKLDTDYTPEESSTPNTELESSEIRSSNSSIDLTISSSSTVSSTDSQNISFFRFDKRFSFPWQRNKKEAAIYSTYVKKSKFKHGAGKSKRRRIKQEESSTLEEETEETISVESGSSVSTLIESTSSNDTITEECSWSDGTQYDNRIITLWHRRYKSGERVAKNLIDNYMPWKPIKDRNELFNKKEKRDPVPLGESQEIINICEWSSNSKDFSDKREKKVKKSLLWRKRPKKRETIYAAYVNTKHCAYNPKKIRKGKVTVKPKRKVHRSSEEHSIEVAKIPQISNAVSKFSINATRNQKLADFIKLDCLSTMPWRRKREQQTVQILRIIKDGNADRSRAFEKLRAEREAALKKTIMGNRSKNIPKFW